MQYIDMLKRDLLFYRRTNLAMGLLAMVCCAVLTGAMLVGASVRYSLLRIAEMRLGNVKLACVTGDRFFRQELADDLMRPSEALVAPVLAFQGILESPDGQTRINHVNIYGITEAFLHLVELVPEEGLTVNIKPLDGAVYSQSLIERLEQYDADLLLRIQSPSALSKDMIFSTDESSSRAWEIKGVGVLPDDLMGRFSLQASQEPPLNVFVPIEWLADKAGVPGKANMLLVDIDKAKLASFMKFKEAVAQEVQIEDYGLAFRGIETEHVFEVRTPSVFIDGTVADGLMKSGEGAVGIFTYFVNEIRFGDKTVPYSTVSAAGSEAGDTFLAGLGDDEIVINEWLADELGAEVGAEIELTYFQIAPTRKLVEQTHSFTVARVVPMMGSFADPTLMPEYPGLSEAGNCRDWDAGIPIDLKKIQKRDEDYWDRYRGTPKAFVSLKTARTIWQNRFGTLTAVRWPADQNTEASIRASVRQQLDPVTAGFGFEDVQRAARESAVGSTDFAGLFAGLSMFLIFSAAILLALVFVFFVESRSSQAGLLLAVGWGWLRIFGLFLAEGAAVALAGCVVGAVLSMAYTFMLIVFLNATFWGKALGSLQLVFHADPVTLFEGILISFLICVLSIQVSLFHRIRRPVHQLLTGVFERYEKRSLFRQPISLWIGLICVGAGVFLSMKSNVKQTQVAMFFAAGTLCLAGLIALFLYFMKWLRVRSGSFVESMNQLAIKNIPRRTGRSLTVLITLACGVFMVVGVGSNYKEVGAEAKERGSGTGGFALLGQSTLPLTEAISIEGQTVENGPGVDARAVVPMRLYAQDEASCLNMNRAQQPSLLGVKADALAMRGAFTFQKTIGTEQDVSGWELLDTPLEGGMIPVIGDYATLYWGLRKDISDLIPYRDENGKPVLLKVVGILKDSMLQGRLFISEAHFVEHFPSVDGYQVFLVDGNRETRDSQAKALTRKYRDFGLEMIETDQKLSKFHEVENTYLAIFLVLGGLGLILGSAGLGLVLVLNVLDRRGEMAMMQAVGFRRRALVKMLFKEHSILLLAGLLCGFVPALWAVFPSIAMQGGAFPFGFIFMLAVGIAVSGMVWIGVMTGWILRGDYLDTLRNE